MRIGTAVLCAAWALAGGARAADAPPLPVGPGVPTYADRPVSWWIEDLVNPRGGDVARAVLRMMGPEAIPWLVRAMHDPRPRLGQEAGRVLVRTVREAKGDLPAGVASDLGVLLDHADPAVRAASRDVLARALAGTSPRPEVAETLLGSTRTEDRRLALRALATVESPSPEAVRAVAALLSDPQPETRLVAAETLRAYGARAGPAAPALRSALGSGTPDVRCAVLRALGLARPVEGETVAALVAAAADPEGRVRAHAVLALAAAAKDDRDALDGLGRLLASTDPELRRNAAAAAGSLGERAEPLVPALARLLADERVDVRMGAEEALDRVGVAAKAALPALVDAAAAGRGGALLWRRAAAWLPEIRALLPTCDAARRGVLLPPLRMVPAEAFLPEARPWVETLAPIVAAPAGDPWGLEVAILTLSRIGTVSPGERDAARLALHRFLAAAPGAEAAPEKAALGVHLLARAARHDPAVHSFLLDVVSGFLEDRGVAVERRVAAVRYLATVPFRDAAKVRAGLLAQFSAQEPEIARAAAEALWADEAAVPDLVARLVSDDEGVRFLALHGLRVGPSNQVFTVEQEEAVDEQVRNGPSPRVRAAAAVVLLRRWTLPMADRGIPRFADTAAYALVLADGMGLPEEDLRAESEAALAALARAAPATADALEGLARAIESAASPNPAAGAQQAREAARIRRVRDAIRVAAEGAGAPGPR